MASTVFIGSNDAADVWQTCVGLHQKLESRAADAAALPAIVCNVLVKTPPHTPVLKVETAGQVLLGGDGAGAFCSGEEAAAAMSSAPATAILPSSQKPSGKPTAEESCQSRWPVIGDRVRHKFGSALTQAGGWELEAGAVGTVTQVDFDGELQATFKLQNTAGVESPEWISSKCCVYYAEKPSSSSAPAEDHASSADCAVVLTGCGFWDAAVEVAELRGHVQEFSGASAPPPVVLRRSTTSRSRSRSPAPLKVVKRGTGEVLCSGRDAKAVQAALGR